MKDEALPSGFEWVCCEMVKGQLPEDLQYQQMHCTVDLKAIRDTYCIR